MTVRRIIVTMYYSEKLCCDVFNYYEGKDLPYKKIPQPAFEKMCIKHSIDTVPSVLFEFFSNKGIRVVVSPLGIADYWKTVVYTDGEALVQNDYNNRLDAVLGALDTAINLYNNIANEIKPNYE